MMARPGWHNTIAITGAGSGFGAALARRYANSGWRVAVTDQDQQRATDSLTAVRESGGGGFAQPLDVTSGSDWQVLFDRIETEWGGVEILVNNAGVGVGGNMEQTPISDWQWAIDINLLGVARGCHMFARTFKHQQAGHIVNIASFAGFAGAPDVAAYGAAKAGVIALSEGLRAEMQNHGVGVSVVCPAFVKTRLTETLRVPDDRDRQRVERWMEQSGVSAEDVARIIQRAVQKNQFMVLTHNNTRWLWRLKRFMPERYFKMLVKAGQTLSRRE